MNLIEWDVSIIIRKYIFYAVILTALVGGAGGAAYSWFLPHLYFDGYPLIALFFFLFGVLTINMTEACRRQFSPGRMVLIYLLARIAKMLVSIVAIAVYCMMARDEMKEILFAFIVNYLIYLIYDSWFYYAFEAKQETEKGKLK